MGDEILSGDTVDTNGARIGQALASLGAPVVRRETVGDEASAIAGAVERALAEGDLVLVTGGLGPTPDDLTREAVAGLLGVPLRLDPDLESLLRSRFQAAGYTDFPERNLAQAMVPEGARVLRNDWGTAPGLALSRGGSRVILLPGVPHELEAMLAGPVRAYVEETFGARLRPPLLRWVRTTGIPESRLAQEVEALLPSDRGPVRLAYLPSFHGVTLRLSVPGEVAAAEGLSWLDRMEGALAALDRYRFPGDDLVAAVAGALEGSGRTLAVAESCTGGLIAKRLTDRPGASTWFLGGVVAYEDRAKVAQLGVPTRQLVDGGAVSEGVAKAMASGARRAFGATAGIGVTGVAGPGGGSEQKPVGTVWFAVDVGGRIRAVRRVFPGGREAVRERAAQAALHLLFRILEGEEGEG